MVKHQSLQEKIIKGSLLTLLLSLLGSFFAYLIRIFYSHNLTVENYGLFYATFGIFSIIAGYSDLGFGYATVYLLPKYLKLKNYSKAWNIFLYGQIMSLTMSFLLILVLITSAPFIAKYYLKVPGSENLIYIFCIYQIAFTLLGGLIQIFTGMQKVKYYSSITVVRWFLTFTFSVIFFLFDFPHITFFALAWALGHVITAIIFLLLLIYKHKYLSKNKIIWDSKIFKQMFSLAYPVIFENFVISTMIFADTFLLTLMRGVREVGIYNIIYPLTMISIILLAPINNLILPLVSHLMEGEKEKLKFLMGRILEIAPFVGIYFSLFLMIFPSSIVGLIFGQKWLGLVELPLVLLSLGSVGFLMSEILGTITIGTGKIRDRLKANAVISAFSITLDIILIWKFGVMGVVITNSLARSALTFWCIRIIKSSVAFKLPLKFYLKLLIFSIIIFSIVKLTGFSPKNLLELMVGGVIYTIIFIVIGFVLKIYDKKLLLMILPAKK